MVEQDEPISALGAASLPLTGNEKVVLVQNGVTKQTDIDNLPQPGGQLNANELAAIQNANLPTGLNPFATLNDLSGSNFPTAIQYNTYEKGVSDVIATMPWYIVQDGAPTVNDDGTKGFRVGTSWFRTVTKETYVLTDATTGAAVWVKAQLNDPVGRYYGFGNNAASGASAPVTAIGEGAGIGNSGNRLIAIGESSATNNTGTDVVAIGSNSVAQGNTLSECFIVANINLPSYANYAAASAAIVGGIPGNTYLYHDQSTNGIGAVRF
jgi:hypothetical protein